MAYPVRYSTRSYQEYESILDYVADRFGLAVAVKVDIKIEEVIDQITINPLQFPYSDKKRNIRRCVISPQTTLYYRFNGEFVEIASFRGSRMDPKTLNL